MRDALRKSGAAVNARAVSGALPRLFWSPILAIGAFVFAAEIPFFFFGTPSGHDVEFHLYSWLEVLSQWKHGIFFPRWAELAHFGFGEPRFIFYPPASWTLGGLIGVIFPWTIASPVFIWTALVLAGASMFVLARRWFDRKDAAFAAVLYAVNPYHLVIVYWRSAFAELLASCLIPLLLLLLLRAAEGERRVVVPLGFLLAASWLTNAPAAVMIHYSSALLVLFFAWRKKSLLPAWIAVGAVLLGACIAAFYLIPAIYEQRWIEIANAISQGSRPIDNFLFIHTKDPDHDAFNRIVSWVAVLEVIVVTLGAIGAKAWRQGRRELWIALSLWAVACAFVMSPASLILWKFLPKMQFMQFPWRWLLCLSMVFTLLTVAGLKRWWMRGMVCAFSVLLIVIVWHRVQEPWWDTAADLREMQDNMDTGVGYEGTDEYTPLHADPGSIDKEARKVTIQGAAHAEIRVQHWDANTKEFTVQSSAADQALLRLFSYPAWKAQVNARDVVTSTRPKTGQMLMPVSAGPNRIDLHFIRTWDRTLGAWISALTLIAIGAWWFGARSRLHPRDSDASNA